MDGATAEKGVRRLFADLSTYLAGPGRPLVPHGFALDEVKSERRPSMFAPNIGALASTETAVALRLPVIWEPVQGRAQASGTPATDNLDELRELIEMALRGGDYPELRAGTLEEWRPTLPEGAVKPSDLEWTVTAKIRSR
jgi:hypothetical protein